MPVPSRGRLARDIFRFRLRAARRARRVPLDQAGRKRARKSRRKRVVDGGSWRARADGATLEGFSQL